LGGGMEAITHLGDDGSIKKDADVRIVGQIVKNQEKSQLAIDVTIAHPSSGIDNDVTRDEAAEPQRAVTAAFKRKNKFETHARCNNQDFDFRVFTLGVFGGLERTHGLDLIHSLANKAAQGGRWEGNYKGLLRNIFNRLSVTLYRTRALLLIRRTQSLRFKRSRVSGESAFSHNFISASVSINSITTLNYPILINVPVPVIPIPIIIHA